MFTVYVKYCMLSKILSIRKGGKSRRQKKKKCHVNKKSISPNDTFAIFLQHFIFCHFFILLCGSPRFIATLSSRLSLFRLLYKHAIVFLKGVDKICFSFLLFFIFINLVSLEIMSELLINCCCKYYRSYHVAKKTSLIFFI